MNCNKEQIKKRKKGFLYEIFEWHKKYKSNKRKNLIKQIKTNKILKYLIGKK